MSFSVLLDVVVGHIAGFAGLQVHNLAPDLAAGNHLQLVSGGQPADGLGGLVGLLAQADAAVILGAAGFRGNQVGVLHGLEVVVPLGDFIFAGLLADQELRLHITGEVVVADGHPAVSAAVVHMHFGAAVQPDDDAAVSAGSFPDVQALSVFTVDPHVHSAGFFRRGEGGDHQGKNGHQDQGEAENLFHGFSFLSAPYQAGLSFLQPAVIIAGTYSYASPEPDGSNEYYFYQTNLGGQGKISADGLLSSAFLL